MKITISKYLKALRESSKFEGGPGSGPQKGGKKKNPSATGKKSSSKKDASAHVGKLSDLAVKGSQDFFEGDDVPEFIKKIGDFIQDRPFEYYDSESIPASQEEWAANKKHFDNFIDNTKPTSESDDYSVYDAGDKQIIVPTKGDDESGFSDVGVDSYYIVDKKSKKSKKNGNIHDGGDKFGNHPDPDSYGPTGLDVGTDDE